MTTPNTSHTGANTFLQPESQSAQWYREAARFMATTRATHAGALLRFALSTEEAQRRMLSEVQQTEPVTAAAAAGQIGGLGESEARALIDDVRSRPRD